MVRALELRKASRPQAHSQWKIHKKAAKSQQGSTRVYCTPTTGASLRSRARGTQQAVAQCAQQLPAPAAGDMDAKQVSRCWHDTLGALERPGERAEHK